MGLFGGECGSMKLGHRNVAVDSRTLETTTHLHVSVDIRTLETMTHLHVAVGATSK